MREMVAFTCLALWHYEIEPVGLASKDGKDAKEGGGLMPEVDLYRSGFGILHSKEESWDLKLKIKGTGA